MRNTGPRTPEATMNRHGVMAVGVALILVLLLFVGSGVAQAGEPSSPEWKKNLPFDLTGEVEAGIQIVQPRGSGISSTFDEYRDLDRTDQGGAWHVPVVPWLRLMGEDKARRGFVEFGGTDLTRMDANYYLNAGLYNHFQFNFEFDRTPHVISHTAQTIYDEPSAGIFRLPAAGAAALNAALVADGTPTSAAERAAILTAVNSLLRPTQLGFQTDAARLGLTWLPLPELELSAGYSMTIRDGRIPVGTVIGSPGGNALELAAPRDERFHEAKFGAEYVRDWYQFRFNYAFSMFENEIDRIEWDNPCGGNAVPVGGCPGPLPGTGRYSTMPDNYAHTVSGATGFNLPWWRTRLTGGFSYAMWRQDETFLPWTTVAGFTGNTTDAGTSSPDAKVDVIHANLNLTTRPLRNVTSTTRYRYYSLDNDTHEHSFTNVLSSEDLAPGAGTHTSEPLDFRKQNASQEIAWRIIPQVTVKGGYEWEHWNRVHREVESTNEHALRGVVDIRPWPWVLARLSYGQGVRTIHAGGYVPPPAMVTALPQFRKFDEADRTRRKGDAYLQVNPIDTLTLSGSFFAQVDDYFNTPYGLQEAKAFGWSADVSWAPIERMSVFLGYAHDEYQSREQSCNISGGPPAACNPLDTFFVKPRDLLDSVQAGLNLDVIPKRLDLGLGYRFSFGRTKFTLTGVPGGAAAGEPTPVDDIDNRFHVFNAVARYFLTPNWTLKLGYQYERYEETDFTTDGIPQSLANLGLSTADVRTIILGAQHPPYEAHIVAFSLGYRF